MNVLINAIAFKIAWLSTIFGGANGLPALGPLAVVVAVGIHLWRVHEPERELTLILMTGAIGLSWDSAMVTAGWLAYPSGTFVAGLAPYWILGMWMLFATTLNVTFRWLQSRLSVAAAMGALFGPLSYLAGSAAGAVEVVQPATVYLALSIGWAILMPGLLMLARQLDGTQAPVIKSPI
jgi:hypothetical protein